MRAGTLPSAPLSVNIILTRIGKPRNPFFYGRWCYTWRLRRAHGVDGGFVKFIQFIKKIPALLALVGMMALWQNCAKSNRGISSSSGVGPKTPAGGSIPGTNDGSGENDASTGNNGPAAEENGGSAENDSPAENNASTGNNAPAGNDAPAQNSAPIENNGSTGNSTAPNTATPNTVAPGDGEASQRLTCPEHFVMVPGNNAYIADDFCVMKYEAKRESVGGGNDRAVSKPEETPWDNINRAAAMAACEASNFQLLTNDHWQTMARNIENVADNWAPVEQGERIGNTEGLSLGHSDQDPGNSLAASGDEDPCSGTDQTCDGETWHEQRRTHRLSNAEVIWDVAGNVWEWVQDDNGSLYDVNGTVWISRLPDSGTEASLSLANQPGRARNAKNQFGPSGNYSALTSGTRGNLGRFDPGNAGGVLRGGSFQDRRRGGIFGTALNATPESVQRPEAPPSRPAPIGFRCWTRPTSSSP